MGWTLYVFVMGGLAYLMYVLGRQDARLDDVCEFCDKNVDKAPHLGMCVECYEFFHVDG